MGVKTVFHLFAALHFWLGCYYDWNYVKVPRDVHNMGESFGFSGKLKFLTFWDALLQGLFFTICLLNDLIGTNDVAPKKTPIIRKIKDFLLPCLALPVALFVAITFWGLYFIDRELVFPRALDAFFPTWLNHVMHTNIVLFAAIELATSFRRYPSRKLGITVVATWCLTYLLWVHVINYHTGLWVYPILEVLPWFGRIIFYVGSLVLQISLYLAGEKLNNVIWRKQLAQKQRKSK
ncbi:unnamed protein product [Brassicogethes aeneus]|uniref:Uncharacterized protein n=1 Tax=Brassicogethes aeneus TaxID=1431903 RepID=A0A9P0BJU4_BRAAE|nr:unnamed protein product [Brassicogethes aeneus]